VKSRGPMKLLLPVALSDKRLDVRTDGKKVDYRIERRGDEVFIVLETDFQNRVLEIR
jgi:hypothetical protein